MSQKIIIYCTYCANGVLVTGVDQLMNYIRVEEVSLENEDENLKYKTSN